MASCCVCLKWRTKSRGPLNLPKTIVFPALLLLVSIHEGLGYGFVCVCVFPGQPFGYSCADRHWPHCSVSSHQRLPQLLMDSDSWPTIGEALYYAPSSLSPRNRNKCQLIGLAGVAQFSKGNMASFLRTKHSWWQPISPWRIWDIYQSPFTHLSMMRCPGALWDTRREKKAFLIFKVYLYLSAYILFQYLFSLCLFLRHQSTLEHKTAGKQTF